MIKLSENRRNVRIADPGGEDDPIRFELFSNEQLVQHAVSLTFRNKYDIFIN
jgi:cyclic beta-1,2-glucan synthetase